MSVRHTRTQKAARSTEENIEIRAHLAQKLAG